MKTTTICRLHVALAVLLSASLMSPTFAQAAPQTDKAQPEKKTQSSFSVKVSGHGAPMILIPGMASSGDTWKSTVAHFQNRYTCHVLTLAGFAGEPPIHGPLLATVREELAAYIQQQHLQKPVIVGHSLGGSVAMDLAAHYPNVAGPIVIVDSLPFFAGVWFQAKTLEDAKPMIAGMKGYMEAQTREQYEQYARSGAATKFMVTSPADLQTLIQWGLRSDPKTVSSAMVELLSEDLRDDLSKITSPVLVLGTWAGLRDQMQPNGVTITKPGVVDTFQAQYAHLPKVHLAMAETARHFIMWDDPQWFFQELDGFLDGKPQTASRD
jgi:pimeloyl-ACP methyl ester carboxylesterase